jgi:FkbM family methyltransferase
MTPMPELRAIAERSQRRVSHALTFARAAARGGDAPRHALRELQFRMLRRLTPVVAVDGDGVRFFVSTRDKGVGLPVFVHGALDAAEMRTAVEVLERTGRHPFRGTDRVFVDIGANIGTSTVEAIVHHGAHGGVAFEPDEYNVEMLGHNLLANGIAGRVALIRAAVTDTSGPVAFEQARDNFGDHRVRLADTPPDDVFGERSRPLTTVPGVTLDSQIEAGVLDLDRVGLVSIDTQGHEAHVLLGARRLCASDVPVMLEYWPYGLRGAGGAQQLRTVIRESYSRYVDLASPFSGGEVTYRPTAELESLERGLRDLGWANLLLFR